MTGKTYVDDRAAALGIRVALGLALGDGGLALGDGGGDGAALVACGLTGVAAAQLGDC